jgi:hypothetical protein
MKMILSEVVVLFLATASILPADFSYEQNSRITGGMVAGAMKMAAVFSKQAREPIHSTIAVKGDRMLHLTATHGSIIDLNQETITSIDFQRKTWSVMTFAEMEQAMRQMSEKMKEKQNDADMKFKVSVNPTGQTKDIGGMAAKEMIMKMEMEMTDQKSGQQGSMIITTDMWLAPKAPGYDEIRRFYERMSAKSAWMPGQPMGMGRPDVSKGMAEVMKEAGKLDGMPVYETIRMGGDGAGAQAAAPGEQPKQQPQQPQPSAGSALGAALGGRFGLGRKKKPADEQQQAPPAESQQQGETSGLLLEMVTETTNFSPAPVDPAKFEVPAGFKQVKPEMRGGTR